MERELADKIAHLMRNVPIILASKTSLMEGGGLIKRCDVLVSNDSGLMHIAYGVGTPTVSLFGAGIEKKWAPLGSRNIIINKNLPCSPCTRYGYTPPCPYGVACMDAIGVEDVMRAIDEVLD